MVNRRLPHGAFAVSDEESHQASRRRRHFPGCVVGNSVLPKRNFARPARIAHLVTKIVAPRASIVRVMQHANSLGEDNRQLGMDLSLALVFRRVLSRRTDIGPIVYA